MTYPLARSSAVQRTQIVPESVIGTPVSPTTKQFPTLRWVPEPQNETTDYRAQGHKFDSTTVPNKEWSTGTLEGAIGFGEMVYLLASLYGNAAVVTSGGHSVWNIGPSSQDRDAPQSYTLEHGDDDHAVQVSGTVVTDLTLDFSRTALKAAGKALGLPFVAEAGMTAAASACPFIENVSVQPGEVNWYMDSTFGSIGTTQLTKVLSAQTALTGRWGPEWVMNRALSSYGNLVELVPAATAMLLLEADSTAMGLFATYRLGSTVYVQMNAQGPVISGGVHYSFILNMPLQIKKLQQFKDEGGVYAVGFDFKPIDDPTAGYAISASITNKTSAL